MFHTMKTLLRHDRTSSAKKSKKIVAKPYRPRFEPLEDRRLMATLPTATLTSGVLTVSGTEAADMLVFNQSAGRLSISGISNTFAASQVSKIVVDGKGGNDQILLNSEARGSQPIQIPSVLHGGAGDDVIIGSAAADQIFGDLGNDKLSGQKGVDTLDGGKGTNQLNWVAASVAATAATATLHADAYVASTSTTLKSAMTADPTNDIIYVNNASSFPKIGTYPLDVKIGNEIMRIQSYSLDNSTWWVTRGQFGTTPQAHAAGSVITPYVVASPPSAPDPITATATSPTQITVSWSNVTGEQSYYVEIKDADGWRLAAGTTADATTATISDLDPSWTYQIQVYAQNAAGSTGSKIISVRTPPAAPAVAPQAPDSINVKVVSQTSVIVSWPAVSGADKYYVQHYVSASQNFYYTASAGQTSMRFDNLTPNMLHYFRVGANNAAGTSYTAWANFFSALPGSPKLEFSKRYSDATETIVNLYWNDVAGETRYTLYQYKNGAWTPIANLAANTTSRYVELANSSHGGWFALLATNSVGSTWSNVLSVYL
jgi:hypothetical protein